MEPQQFGHFRVITAGTNPHGQDYLHVRIELSHEAPDERPFGEIGDRAKGLRNPILLLSTNFSHPVSATFTLNFCLTMIWGLRLKAIANKISDGRFQVLWVIDLAKKQVPIYSILDDSGRIASPQPRPRKLVIDHPVVPKSVLTWDNPKIVFDSPEGDVPAGEATLIDAQDRVPLGYTIRRVQAILGHSTFVAIHDRSVTVNGRHIVLMASESLHPLGITRGTQFHVDAGLSERRATILPAE